MNKWKFSSLALVAILASPSVLATTTYRCPGPNGVSFQQTPCAGASVTEGLIQNEQGRDVLRSQARDAIKYASTPEEAQRLETDYQCRFGGESEAMRVPVEECIKKVRAAKVTRAAQEAAMQAKVAADNEARIQKRREEDEALTSLIKLCASLEDECMVDQFAGLLEGMTMGDVESVLGAPREQKLGSREFFYHTVKLRWSNRITQHRLQLEYELVREPIRGRRVSEVNYH